MLGRYFYSVLLLAFVVLALNRLYTVHNADYAILSTPNYLGHEQTPSKAFYSEQEISTGQEAYNHSPSIAALPNGTLISVWYAGAREGGTDMKLKTSLFESGQWGEPKTLLSASDIPYVTRRIGNAVVYVHPETPEKTTILFTSTLGGWATSYLNTMVSNNNGQSWGPIKRLTLGNVFNFSHLVRCTPLFLSRGRVAIPAYHEFINKFGLMLMLDADAQVLETVKLSSGRDGLQPCIAVNDGVPTRAFLRDANSQFFNNKLLTVALNKDFSPSSALQMLEVTNEDTSLATASFNGGHVLVYNDSLEKNNLSLAYIKGNNITKLHVFTKDYSGYPYLIKQGTSFHLVYNKNRTIVHTIFNEQFLMDKINAASH